MIKKLFILILFFTFQLFSQSDDAVKKEIESILKKLPSTTKVALLIVKPLTQDTIFQLNHTRSMIPASNTKLFTTAASLSILGGDFVLSTKILSDDNDLSDSTINGNIYIKGYGNSLFTSSDMDSLVNVIKDMGIKKITGNVIGDDSFFDEIYSRKDWIDDEHANVRLPAISGLVVDRNRRFTYRKRRG
ncbi:MAG: D-alanyl-D-alanine carboxypeptidase, partial [Ignavibacteriaceae bacterium]